MEQEPQCKFFVVRKKRLCRMTVKPGRQYCGEHEPQPKTEDGLVDNRIPCPLDPKHTCYASKLEKHLSICNARPGEVPPYIVHNINAPADSGGTPRIPLSQIPKDKVMQLIDKINRLYENYLLDKIQLLPEKPIHKTVMGEFNEPDRTESSLRHLRQVSRLLHIVQDEGLVNDNTCYVELGAGKGQVSYFACAAWCGAGSGSGAAAVERAARRHKRDTRAPAAARVRADLAHVALAQLPRVQRADHVVGLAKHLCGVATDFALRCMTAPDVLDKTRGVVIATCCHHRCERAHYFGSDHLQELGITTEELNIMFGIVSWATCGDGRSRDRRQETSGAKDQDELHQQEERARAGRRCKAVLEWGRVLRLRELGLRARLVLYVPTDVSLENLCIIATR